ncbi:MAG: 4-alpha-glucanotransferase, partial [Nitrospirota bacterium]
MIDENRLGKLCALLGIGLEYRDIWGNLRTVSVKTILALAAGFGYKISGEESLERAISDVERRDWLSVLPPVMVLKETKSLEVPVTLPASASQKNFTWIFTHENGSESRGGFIPASLPAQELRRLDDRDFERRILQIGISQGLGYHSLTVREDGGVKAETAVIIVPEKCYLPDALKGDRKVWGIAAQLYTVRSGRNWGIGDFTDLRELMDDWGPEGAAVVGVNPLHAMFPYSPNRYSPYGPSSRLCLNIFYIDVEAVQDYIESPEAKDFTGSAEFQARIHALRDAELLDNEGVYSIKLEVLGIIYRGFRQRHLSAGSGRGQEFRDFQARKGHDLRTHCLYEAMSEKFRLERPAAAGWRDWPAEYQDPASPEVLRFAEENIERIEFFEYAQWQASVQLAAAGMRSMELGLGIGLYQDLAVGANKDGSETWANGYVFAQGVTVGSPPDDFNLKGQIWDMAPMDPLRIKESRYGLFISVLRENMRTTGAIRIDHIMATSRLFWVPEGMGAPEGAYVSYPVDDLIGILALESVRNRCAVIGEDLGTIPESLPSMLREYGIYSSRVLYLEEDEKGFRPPASYPEQATVVATTHDLPTLTGFWQGRDLQLRKEHGAYPSDEMRERQVMARSKDRTAMLVALENEGLLPEGLMSEDPATVPEMSSGLILAVYSYLARTPSKILMVQLCDITGEPDQVNLPGTEGVRSNWRRKLGMTLDEIKASGTAQKLAALLRQERGAGRDVDADRSKDVAETKADMIRLLTPEIPRATYRIQFSGGFTFRDAAEVVPYLSELGVSHCYCSPYLKTRKGSPHGYDIIDHNSLNPEIGTEEDYERFVGALKSHGMGQVLDIVPNHMAVGGSDNAWWLDVLENGQASVYAGFFDIDWQPVNASLRGKIHLPVLEDQYGNVLERGDLKPSFDKEKGELSVSYYAHRFPIDPIQYPAVLGRRMDLLEQALGPDNPLLLEFQSLITSFGHLPPQREKNPQRLMERNRDKEIYKKQLAQAYMSSPELAGFIDGNVAELSGQPGRPGSFDPLHELLEKQAYRLAFWRVAADEINYRRFFDINDLAGLRTEDPQVFEKTHGLILRLVAEGKVQGLRVDHPDGLQNPKEYFERLNSKVAQAKLAGSGKAETAGTEELALQGTGGKAIYVVAEKILAGGKACDAEVALIVGVVSVAFRLCELRPLAGLLFAQQGDHGVGIGLAVVKANRARDACSAGEDNVDGGGAVGDDRNGRKC